MALVLHDVLLEGIVSYQVHLVDVFFLGFGLSGVQEVVGEQLSCRPSFVLVQLQTFVHKIKSLSV